MNGQRWITLGVVGLIILLLIALAMPAIQQAREAARRQTSKNNLKQIGLALHNYHDIYACFPPGGIIRQDGMAMHGWMMSITLFLSQNDLSVRLDYDQPWNSPQNAPVYAVSIPAFLIQGRDLGRTSDGYGITFYMGNPNLLHRNQTVRLREITKGSSHTWFAGEVAGNYQPWGYPFNWRSLGTKLCDGPNSFGQPAWGGGHLLRADGNVTFISDQASPRILQALAKAPPVATPDQTAVPDRRFTIGAYSWKHIELQSDPQGKQQYKVKVLRSPAGQPLKIFFYASKRFTPEELEYPKLNIAVLRFKAHIGPQTEIASTLKATTLAEETTPAQFQANVKLLQKIQQQLPRRETSH
ncbi:hypothetical protein Pan153_30090 [Gimesia panareensis]|uniref:DUF1559 domain-containing protein n=1 Tax=Gimesia panareensis TaxID=2527978 RepID=A0A518FPS5_9PLAN|nr:DUF1559 domain-containing protein [Gimesia panareensis]QDV18352.1 hypothetical protein Pan153_30090 [Gimesia panareensis]